MRWWIVFLRMMTMGRYARERSANQPIWALMALAVLVLVAILAPGVYEVWRLFQRWALKVCRYRYSMPRLRSASTPGCSSSPYQAAATFPSRSIT
jgi:hypothetical protein